MKKRQAIIEFATRLFGSVGYDATTTLEIAHEADVTEPLIFYHFKGKSELFTSSLELAFKEYFLRFDTLTAALPISPGQIWSTNLKGIALSGITVSFEK